MTNTTDGQKRMTAITNEINAARYKMLLRKLGPSIASLMHCKEAHIGIELDELVESEDKRMRGGCDDD